MKRKLTFITDPGHGWLSVPIKDLIELDIVELITPYSYMKGNRAYLEEDCDANVYLGAAEKAGWEVEVRLSDNANRAALRSYPSYNPVMVALWG